LGFAVVIVGSSRDIGPLNENMMDYRVKTDIHELRELIRHASVFVGVDSGPANICQTTETPGVVIFTATDPGHIVCSSNIVPVTPPKDKCRFCQQRQKPPCGYIDCPEGKNYECSKSIRVEDIKAAIGGKL
jgi:ADP-heptose:LPS heptosyltransferase